jgi:hypothetical protein
LIGLFLFYNKLKNENLKIFLKKKTTKNKIQDYQDTTSFDKSKNQWCSRNFILDTGASNSCVGFESVDLFALEAKNQRLKAAGAGATGMFTQLALKINCNLVLGRF